MAGTDGTDVRAAVEAAQAVAEPGEKPRVVMVPRLDGKYARVGALGVVEQVGRLPGGDLAAVVRGTERVRIGAGTTGPGAALWVQVEVAPVPPVTDRARELAKEYKSLVITMLQQRGAWQVVDSVQQEDDPSALADLAGYAPYLSDEQKVWLLETADVAERLEKLLEWGREHLAELDVAETIRKDVKEGMERQQREFLLRQQLSAIRKELAELDGKPESEEEDYRARVEAADAAGEGARGRDVRGGQAGADLRAVARGGLDPHLARHRARAAVEHADRRRLRHRRARGRSSTPTTPGSTT